MAWPFDVDAPTFNTGLMAVPTGLTVISTDTVYLMGAFFSNPSGTSITILLTNTAGDALAPTMEVPAGMAIRVPIELFQPTVGLKWQAGGSGLKGQVYGYD